LAALVFAGCAPSAPPADPPANVTNTNSLPGDVNPGGAKPGPVKSADTRPSAAPQADNVLATVHGIPIRRDDVERRLMFYYGLDVVLQEIQLQLARDQAKKEGITVTPEDIKAELPKSMTMILGPQDKVDYEALLPQILQTVKMSRPAFDAWVETNAYLRKIIEPKLSSLMTEQVLRDAFGILYGEKAVIRHIQLGHHRDVDAVIKRLGEGQKFEDVAKALSQDKMTGPMGGELPPFARDARAPVQALKDAAFALAPGQVSDPIKVGETIQIIKLERKIAPVAIKFEDPEVQQIVRAWVYNSQITALIRAFRQEFQKAKPYIQIHDAVLRDQFRQRDEEANAKVKSEAELREKMAQEHDLAATRASTQPLLPPPPPSTRPATRTIGAAPSGAPAGATPSAGGRPPATRPG